MTFYKKKPANHKAYHIPWSQEIIPPSRISLVSTLCTQGLFTPIAGDAWEVPCVEDSSGGLRRIGPYR